jgi:hypothetical protein
MKKLAYLVSAAFCLVMLGASGAQAQTPEGAQAPTPEVATPNPDGQGGAEAVAPEEDDFIVEEEAVVPEKLSAAQVEAAAATEAAEEGFLGIPEYQIIRLLGILTWLLMAVAVVTRLIKSRKHALKLFKAHKYAAWAAFAVATIHGLIVLI